MFAHGHPVDHCENSELWICAFAHSTQHVLADEAHAAVPQLSGSQLVASAVVTSAPGATFTRLGEHRTHLGPTARVLRETVRVGSCLGTAKPVAPIFRRRNRSPRKATPTRRASSSATRRANGWVRSTLVEVSIVWVMRTPPAAGTAQVRGGSVRPAPEGSHRAGSNRRPG